MSITKNRQSPGTLHALAAAAFPDKQVRAVTELTEGMFNAAYRFDFVDDSASLLKIAAARAESKAQWEEAKAMGKPETRKAMMQAERDKQIEEANKRKAEAAARINAAHGK